MGRNEDRRRGCRQKQVAPRPSSVLARVEHPIHRCVDLYKFIGQTQSLSLPSLL